VFRAGRIPTWTFNRVLGLGLEAEATREQTRAMLDSLAELGVPHGVSLAPTARPDDIGAWLIDWGFEQTTTLARMRRGVDALPTVDTDASIRQVGRQDAQVFGETAAAGFGFPAALAPLFSGIVGLDGWRAYLAYDGGQPVATGALYLHGKVGWLGFGSTVPDYRKRGIHRAMMAKRMVDAADLGCRSLQTETNFPNGDEPAPSFHNMMRLDFEVAYGRPNYVLTPPAA
jgi:GNAT superfamily N-acetyltransferase